MRIIEQCKFFVTLVQQQIYQKSHSDFRVLFYMIFFLSNFDLPLRISISSFYVINASAIWSTHKGRDLYESTGKVPAKFTFTSLSESNLSDRLSWLSRAVRRSMMETTIFQITRVRRMYSVELIIKCTVYNNVSFLLHWCSNKFTKMHAQMFVSHLTWDILLTKNFDHSSRISFVSPFRRSMW